MIRLAKRTVAGATDAELPDDSVEDTIANDSQREPQEGTPLITKDDGAAGPSDEKGTDGERPDTSDTKPSMRRRLAWILVFVILPILAILMGGVAGYLRWVDGSARESADAAIQSVQAATDSTIKMLSYQPDSAEKDLGVARDRLTGNFKDSYTQLINDIVIPGAKQKRITAVANVPAASSISATGGHAVVMLFVNQSIIVGNDPPSSTASAVRVTLDKVGDNWLVSDFTPI